ncbi:hypothetical protein OV208_21815 [Corallococcus sp. bb12-1]|uniref:hypothetical protein n=1 Tax=Corallococcus sp. bb12-1 TaxID=2996784 RepID=UPI00226FC21B|nr:hypothetical protein [Corallococcus sp. bb12-1]MCY1043968.1 hypothetical protein [Corallococcus sp. bb12-1]
MKKTLQLEVRALVDVGEPLAGRAVKARGVGLDNDLWLLAEGGEVLHYVDLADFWERIPLPSALTDFHEVQPLPGNEVLLVSPRCRYRSTQPERNARVYSREGTLVREMTLGDGIADVQATADGQVWVSYFDEGIFGNYGWGHGDAASRPIGEDGLVRFDVLGQRLSSDVKEAMGLHVMADCYALNVASEHETWFYSYTDFPLIRMRTGRVPTVWESPVRGAHAIVVSDTHVLFGGGYEDSCQLQLFTLYDRGVQRLGRVATVVLTDETGRAWRPTWLTGRGPWLHGAEGTRHFRVHLSELLAQALT